MCTARWLGVSYAPMGSSAISTGQRRPDLSEAFEIGRVAAMKNRASVRGEHEPPEATVLVVQHSCAPMMAGRQGDRKIAALETAPVVEFVDALETQVVHEVAHAERYHDGLVGRNGPERAPVEMVEVRVRDEHEVDHRQFVQMDAWRLEPLDSFEPE